MKAFCLFCAAVLLLCGSADARVFGRRAVVQVNAPGAAVVVGSRRGFAPAVRVGVPAAPALLLPGYAPSGAIIIAP